MINSSNGSSSNADPPVKLSIADLIITVRRGAGAGVGCTPQGGVF